MRFIKKFRFSWFDWLTVMGILLIGIFLYIGYQKGVFDSRESLVQYVESFGARAVVVFIFIQFLQVILPFFPAALTCVAGVILFGPVWGLVYNYIGICLGSFGAFFISKRYGQALVENMMSEKIFARYEKSLKDGKTFDRLFMFGIFAPIAPDDALCYLAGLTNMTFKKFALIILLGKPVNVSLYSLGWSAIVEWLNII